MPKYHPSPIETPTYEHSEDRPFRMSELPYEDPEDLQRMGDGNFAAYSGNRFFGGICLALPLSALLWGLAYYLLQHLAF